MAVMSHKLDCACVPPSELTQDVMTDCHVQKGCSNSGDVVWQRCRDRWCNQRITQSGVHCSSCEGWFEYHVPLQMGLVCMQSSAGVSVLCVFIPSCLLCPLHSNAVEALMQQSQPQAAWVQGSRNKMAVSKETFLSVYTL